MYPAGVTLKHLSVLNSLLDVPYSHSAIVVSCNHRITAREEGHTGDPILVSLKYLRWNGLYHGLGDDSLRGGHGKDEEE